MPAYFSSKFTKQFHAAFTAALLVFCLLGTHWIGLSHSISHAQIQSHSEVNLTPSDKQPALNHSSEVCHLFNALALAGFVVIQPPVGIINNPLVFSSVALDASAVAQATIDHYQSRAPPSLLL